MAVDLDCSLGSSSDPVGACGGGVAAAVVVGAHARHAISWTDTPHQPLSHAVSQLHTQLLSLGGVAMERRSARWCGDRLAAALTALQRLTRDALGEPSTRSGFTVFRVSSAMPSTSCCVWLVSYVVW
jgi:hypothetical protein